MTSSRARVLFRAEMSSAKINRPGAKYNIHIGNNSLSHETEKLLLRRITLPKPPPWPQACDV
jgi:hypothetical protein